MPNGVVELPATTQISYTYDGNGNVKTVDEEKETLQGVVVEQTQKTYDSHDRLQSVLRYDGQLVSYAYDAVGNRLSVADPGGVATTYTYDAQNRLRTAVVPGAGTTSYALSPDGLALGSTRPGVNERRCYDAGGRLETIVTSKSAITDDCMTATPISRFDYAYDANGNRVSQLEQRTDPGSQSLQAPEPTTYGYDDLDRLTSVVYPDDRAVFYGLDTVGNRRNECEARPSIAGAIATLAACLALAPPALAVNIERHFDTGDRLVQRVDHLDPSRSQVLGYDQNGNRVSEFGGGRSRSYAWDVRNTLTSVSDDGFEVGRYDYDHELQRAKRSAQGLVVEYVLDDHFVLLETAPGGTRVRRYHYSHDPLALAESTGPPQWLHADALGSVTDTTTTSGDVTAVRQHDAWGEYRNGTAPDANEARLGFTGHQYDPESALTYARARFYDAANGVFLSRDPYEGSLSNAPSLHRYLYVHGNPIRYGDPAGEAPSDVVNEWELQRAEYHEWLASQLTPETTLSEMFALAIPTISIELGAGLMDLGRLGEGVAEGGIKGYATDAIRAVSLGMIGFGVARTGLKPASPKMSPKAPPSSGAIQESPMQLPKRGSTTTSCVNGRCGSAKCFVAGTPVVTRAGRKSIEKVVVGEYVLSRNDATGQIEWKKIVQLFVTHDREVLIVGVQGDNGVHDELGTTPNHPFWVVGVGWVPAGELEVGDVMLTATGGRAVVEWLKDSDTGQTTYNFEVEDFHTYFVGKTETWVHNAGGECKIIEGGTGSAKLVESSVPASARASEKVGRGGTKLKPDPVAQAEHTTFKRDPQTGKVTSHAEWDAAGHPVKRTDVTGAAHGPVKTPHTHEYSPPNVNPNTGKSYPGNELFPRPANPDEIPK